MFATSTGGRRINGGVGMLVCDGGVRDLLVPLRDLLVPLVISSSCFGGVVEGVGAELSLSWMPSLLISFMALCLLV